MQQHEPLQCNRPYQITVVADGDRTDVVAESDASLLQAMIRANAALIPVGCRGGGCGICRIQVIEGRFRSLPMSRSRISLRDEEAGIVLACRVYPESDMQIIPMPLRLAGKKWTGGDTGTV